MDAGPPARLQDEILGSGRFQSTRATTKEDGMKLEIYQADSFSSKLFQGNPAAVVPLTDWLPDETMLSIAAENNLSETAFYVPRDEIFELRWFTPTVEVDLCGHATLATAFVLFEEKGFPLERISFETRSGGLEVTRRDGVLWMDFPKRRAQPGRLTNDLVKALGAEPGEVHRSRDVMAVFETQDEVASLKPRFDVMNSLDTFAVMATAPGNDCDFVCRFFAPRAGIPEDPATGSAYCTLVPYWSERMGKKKLHALQISKRGGEIFCEDRNDRVGIGGQAVLYMRGTIEL
jgi:PhzF family phenazine biosynthesis protein